MKAPATLETERLLIRRPQPGDAESIFLRYAADPEVTQFVGWPTHTVVDDTKGFLAFCDAEWTRWPAGPYLVLSRADGTLLGGTGLGFETVSRASTGYVLARDAWGRGIATEALQAMVGLAGSLGVQRLYAICHVQHRASAHVLEKCGFAREGILRRHERFPNLTPPAVADVLCYSTIFDGGRQTFTQ